MTLRNLLATVLAFSAFAACAGDAYIETTGQTAIDTGYYFNERSRIEVEFQATKVEKNWAALVSSWQGSGPACAILLNGSQNLSARIGSSGWNALIEKSSVDTSLRYRVVIDAVEKTAEIFNAKTGATIKKNTESGATVSGTSSIPLALFGMIQSSDSKINNANGSWRIYSFKASDRQGDGSYKLARDLVPAKKNGSLGFFDRVGEVFYSETFVSGSAVDAGLLTSGGELLEVSVGGAAIENDGTSIINTGVLTTRDLRLEVDFEIVDVDKTQARVFASYDTEPTTANDSCGLFVKSDGIYQLMVLHGWSPKATGVYVDSRRHTFVVDVPNDVAQMKSGTVVSKDWKLSTLNGTSTQLVGNEGRPVGLFGRCTKTSGTQFWVDGGKQRLRIYGAKFFKNGTPVRDLVPHVKGGVAGFKDKVTGEFLMGENPAAFKAVGRVPSEDDDGYVELWGNAGTGVGGYCFDTGYKAGPTTRIELDYAMAGQNPSTNWCLFGGADVGFWANKTDMGGKIATEATLENVGAQKSSANNRRLAVLDSEQGLIALVTSGYTNAVAVCGSLSAEEAVTVKIGADGTGDADFAPLKIYSVRIYEAGVLVKSFLPVMKGSVPYLKSGDEYIAPKLSANSSTAGRVLEGGLIACDDDSSTDAYVEFGGGQTLDTGYYANGNSCFVMDFALLTACNKPSQQFLFETANTADDGFVGRIYTNGSGGNNAGFAYNSAKAGHYQGIGVNCDLLRRTIKLDLYNDLVGMTPGLPDMALTPAGKDHNYPCTVTTRVGSKATGSGCNAAMRVYGFKIYESGELVHDFVPYKSGDAVGLYDVKEKKFRTGSGLKIGGLGVNGADSYSVLPNKNTKVSRLAGSKTVTAVADGATSYVWTCNGQVVEGETGGSIDVTWRDSEEPDVYTVKAVYDVFGVKKEGVPQAFTMTNTDEGMRLLIH